MRFRLNILKDGKPTVWVYNNVTNRFYDENENELLTEYPTIGVNSTYPFTRNDNPIEKSNDITLLEIHLGTKCNFHCKYCSQTAFRNSAYSARPEDVPPFIELLRENVKRAFRIQLWGGEPFVYWKVIEKLVPELRKLYPEAHISAPSNGSLLTREKVDFLNKYGMYLYISHDGCGNEMREDEKHGDILKDPVVKDALDYAYQVMPHDRIAFNATPAHGNTNPEKIIRWFKKNVNNEVNVSTHNVVRCHNSFEPESAKASLLTEEERKEYSDGVFKVLLEHNPNDYSLKKKMDMLITGWVGKFDISTIVAECPMPSEHGLVVNLKGDVLQCHNHPIQTQVFGHLSNLSNVNPLGYVHALTKRRCRECLLVHGCAGGCPSSDDKANELACPNLYALWWGCFRGAMASLFGVYLQSYSKIG